MGESNSLYSEKWNPEECMNGSSLTLKPETKDKCTIITCCPNQILVSVNMKEKVTPVLTNVSWRGGSNSTNIFPMCRHWLQLCQTWKRQDSSTMGGWTDLGVAVTHMDKHVQTCKYEIHHITQSNILLAQIKCSTHPTTRWAVSWQDTRKCKLIRRGATLAPLRQMPCKHMTTLCRLVLVVYEPIRIETQI